jgi:hypothetical protein
MTRRLFTITSAVSLLLCAGSIAAWVYSNYRAARVTYYFRDGSLIELVIDDQHLLEVYAANFPPMPGNSKGEAWFEVRTWKNMNPPPRAPYTYAFAGFGWGRYADADVTTAYVSFPVWALTLIFLVSPVAWFYVRFRNAPASNICRKCGYDLTGNVSGVCPECGTAIAKADARTRRASPTG